MTSARFDLGSTLKTLNFSLFRFFERSQFQNHGHYSLLAFMLTITFTISFTTIILCSKL